MDKIQVDIFALQPSPTTGGGAFALILRELNGNRRLPIIIGAHEAQAIAIELENLKPPRPLTHDLIKSIIEALGATISEIVITELKEGTFYSKIFLETITGTIEVDSRPSDAIAIAVRMGAPIYVDSSIMTEASFEVESEEEEKDPVSKTQPKENEKLSKEEMLKKLTEQLEESIKNENYEIAAKIRDEINKLKSME
ncbi:MAG TPA: bifunctional nuclease family protein [Bacteroidota bacterium]|nr:bifunctional nuclease family protein [Bacteroidota bacterium]